MAVSFLRSSIAHGTRWPQDGQPAVAGGRGGARGRMASFAAPHSHEKGLTPKLVKAPISTSTGSPTTFQ